MVGGFGVGWVGVECDRSKVFVAIFGEKIGVGGIFLIVVEEELTQSDGGVAVGFVVLHVGAGIILVKIVFVVVGGEGGDLGFDATLGV